MTQTNLDYPVVALVGSAGGIPAVSRVLERLPASFDAAVLVLIHQDPLRTGHLVEVLRRACALPVAAVVDGQPLRRGEVGIVPAGKHLLIARSDHEPLTALIVSGTFPPSRPSADLLLATLATAVGDRAVAVILSGGGNDGATGATAVHACGGVVLATDETSSSHYSMPLSAIERDDAVDRVLPLDDIVPALVELLARRPVAV